MEKIKMFKNGDKVKILKESIQFDNNVSNYDDSHYNKGVVISSRWDNRWLPRHEEVVKCQMEYGSEYGFLVMNGVVQGGDQRVIKYS